MTVVGRGAELGQEVVPGLREAVNRYALEYHMVTMGRGTSGLTRPMWRIEELVRNHIPAANGRATRRLTKEQADAVEAEMCALEADPNTTLRQIRLFMQWPMPCGHAAGNLLTCDSPPFGCVICNDTAEDEA